jgi:DNA invertase Pin-like site-specific DNA recombinase
MAVSPTASRERKLVAYLRVSTDKQGIRGLGIEAQRKAVHDFVHKHGDNATLLAEYLEVESGRRADRPELWKAIDHARNAGALLVIAKLDRLSRDVHFLTGLDKAGIEFVACDMPNANRLTVTILAAVAEHEREMISQRTKVALAIARQRVIKDGQRKHPRVKRLGNPNGAAALGNASNTKAIAALKAQVVTFDERIYRFISSLRENGFTTIREISEELNRRGVLAARGGTWHPTAVQRIIKRQTYSNDC